MFVPRRFCSEKDSYVSLRATTSNAPGTIRVCSSVLRMDECMNLMCEAQMFSFFEHKFWLMANLKRQLEYHQYRDRSLSPYFEAHLYGPWIENRARSVLANLVHLSDTFLVSAPNRLNEQYQHSWTPANDISYKSERSLNYYAMCIR